MVDKHASEANRQRILLIHTTEILATTVVHSSLVLYLDIELSVERQKAKDKRQLGDGGRMASGERFSDRMNSLLLHGHFDFTPSTIVRIPGWFLLQLLRATTGVCGVGTETSPL